MLHHKCIFNLINVWYFSYFPYFSEVELEKLRREKLFLIQRVSELESGAISGQPSAPQPREGSSNMYATRSEDCESSISGIVHEVRIQVECPYQIPLTH